MTLPSTDEKLSQALTQLLAGQPTRTNGELTVTNLCLEAGVGRDSFYRSPIKDDFAACRTNVNTHKPETARLREEIRQLTAAHKAKRAVRVRAQRELEDHLHSYANQFQALTVDNHRLATENTRLLQHLDNPPTALHTLHRP
ncbi:hypothetical protein ACFZBE_29790 [Streptomyces sp. NPDC008061]|uniref:hypothetical protein n=1 Tax=Streptomyces sp. NPDC008061 TaxID=3364805 RepID=UPI0036EFB584